MSHLSQSWEPKGYGSKQGKAGLNNAKAPCGTQPNCIYHGYSAVCQPRGLSACCSGSLYTKKDIIMKAGKEMLLCWRGWCHPCKQNCRAQLDCRRDEREAQDKTCLLLTGWEHQEEQGWHTEWGLSLLPPRKPKTLAKGSALMENHQWAEVQWVWTGPLALVNVLPGEFPSAKHDQCQALHVTPTLPDGVLLIQAPPSS